MGSLESSGLSLRSLSFLSYPEICEFRSHTPASASYSPSKLLSSPTLEQLPICFDRILCANFGFWWTSWVCLCHIVSGLIRGWWCSCARFLGGRTTWAAGSFRIDNGVPCLTSCTAARCHRPRSGCHPNLLQFSAYAAGKEEIAPSEIIKIDYRGKNDYTVETIYLEDGSTMSAASVAAPFKNYILAGNVMDDSFFIIKRKE